MAASSGSILPDFARRYPNLADHRLGARTAAASDEFFAPAARIIRPEPPVFVPGKYDENGKWMDGWETRRRRGEGHDWLVLKLGGPALIAGFDIDTTHFSGNQPSSASIEAAAGDREPLVWHELVGATELKPDSHHWLKADAGQLWTTLRLNIFPDGGIARLRVHGRLAPVAGEGELADLAAIGQGGRIIEYSDAHFGAPENLLMPGRGRDMGDGWETRRRRGPGYDWVVVALGCPGILRRAEVDTAHFKGNCPAACSLQADEATGSSEGQLGERSAGWPVALEQSALEADSLHAFELDGGPEPVTHVRFCIHPDGGVSRLRIFAEARP